MKRIVNIISFIIIIMITAHQAGGQTLPTACGGSIVRYGVTGFPTSLYQWELLDSSDRFLLSNSDTLVTSDTVVDVLWSYSSKIHKIVFSEITVNTIGPLTFNCIGVPDTGSVLVDAPAINLSPMVEICADTFHVYSAPAGFIKYFWMDPNNDSTKSQSITVTQPGMYWVEVTDTINCKRIDSSELVVHSIPKVFLGNDTVLCGETPLTLDAGNAGSNFVWSQWLISDNTKTNETGQQFVVSEGGKVLSVKVTDIFGCKASDTISVFGCTANQILGLIPNTFTPNGDGDHETWHIGNLDLLPFINDITKVEIYDRWGRMVHKSALGKANDWDGTNDNHKALPMDSYYYIFFIEGQKPVMGNITIIR